MRFESLFTVLIVAAIVGGMAVISLNPTAGPSFSVSTTSTSSVSVTTSNAGLGKGFLNGTVGIGSLRPVCQVNSSSSPVPNYIASMQAVVTSRARNAVYVPIDWSLFGGCEAIGSFKATLDPGSYTLNLNSCSFMGCKAALPKTFTILPDRTTNVEVMIETGIV
ncbi:MAG: hypothetical protein LYZ70_05125 [Nitrososphaerales archaeon]|nr:hypothetical protein [Nitrososphaerales archaeon]